MKDANKKLKDVANDAGVQQWAFFWLITDFMKWALLILEKEKPRSEGGFAG